jgi:two-component system chemotaxis response regulator CheY
VRALAARGEGTTMTKHILIVDADPTARRALMRSIRAAGIDGPAFAEADDAAEGARALAAGSFDLILADVGAASIHGLDAFEAATRCTGAAPPVVVTGTAGEHAARAAGQRGARGYLAQPFTPERIDEVLGPFLR